MVTACYSEGPYCNNARPATRTSPRSWLALSPSLSNPLPEDSINCLLQPVGIPRILNGQLHCQSKPMVVGHTW